MNLIYFTDEPNIKNVVEIPKTNNIVFLNNAVFMNLLSII